MTGKNGTSGSESGSGGGAGGRAMVIPVLAGLGVILAAVALASASLQRADSRRLLDERDQRVDQLGRSLAESQRVIAETQRRIDALSRVPGPEGPEGPRGAAGPRGVEGKPGPIGPQGPAGPAGSQGPRGLEGPRGAAGPEGVQGPPGPQGDRGSIGERGPEGARGPEGPQGPSGAAGERGLQGPPGTAGVTGPAGERGPAGPRGPAGAAPPGIIAPYAGPPERVPEGWMICDGRLLARADQPALFAAIGSSWARAKEPEDQFRLPDLRGLFLRGTNANREGEFADPDAARREGGNRVGSLQLDGLIDHTHEFSVFRKGSPSKPGLIEGGAYDDAPLATVRTGGSQEGARTRASETRPKNAAVLYIIKL